MKSQFKLALYHFRMAIGVFGVAIVVAILPDCSLRTALKSATCPLEWEAGIQ